jgi:hypothetical protein
MRARVPIVILIVGLAAAAMWAQAKPDFSGEWTMVPEKSDFGPLPAPSKQTRTITHKEPVLKIVIVQTAGTTGDTTIQTTFSTDGKPQHNTVNGSDMTTVGAWEGTTLVFKSALSMQGTDVAVEDRYALSDGGKTLTVTRAFTTADGTGTAKIVMAKK